MIFIYIPSKGKTSNMDAWMRETKVLALTEIPV